jgi:hypothetical protein
MVKQIVRDPLFLQQKSEPATKADAQVVVDLMDTESGMGNDEMYICQDNNEKDLAIFELGNVLAGHFSFGPQRAVMSDYYASNRRKFIPHRV